MWPKKKTTENVRLDGSSLPTEIRVNHTIEHKPWPLRPRPTTITYRIINNVGEHWTVPPQMINGNYAVRVAFPLAFITGRSQDSNTQVQLEGEVLYDEPSRRY